MLQFTPVHLSSDEPNLAKKNCSCERALTLPQYSLERTLDFTAIPNYLSHLLELRLDNISSKASVMDTFETKKDP